MLDEALSHKFKGFELQVEGFGFRVEGFGFRVEGVGFEVQGRGVRVWKPYLMRQKGGLKVHET